MTGLVVDEFGEGGSNTQYSTFIGSQLDNGLGLALLYSGSDGSTWRNASDQKVNDLALKFRHELSPSSEVYGKPSYFDVRSRTPGGLTVSGVNLSSTHQSRQFSNNANTVAESASANTGEISGITGIWCDI